MTTEDNEITKVGGVRLDGFNATWPFARLFATQQEIMLECFSKTYRFKKNNIIGLRQYNGLFSKGLLIEHEITDYPHHVVFWVIGFLKFKNQIETLGYSVGLPRKSDAWWRLGP